MTEEEAKEEYRRLLLIVTESAAILNSPQPEYNSDLWDSLEEYKNSVQTEIANQSNRCSEAAINISSLVAQYPELAVP